MIHRIGVISDTHDLLRPEVKAELENCEAIIHGGDISSPKILSELSEYAPVYAVRGNNDKEWAEHIPPAGNWELFEKHYYVTHKKKDIPAGIKADVIIFGHTHNYFCEKKGDTLYLNPGSCGPGRFHQPITMAVLTTDDEREGIEGIWVEKIGIAHKKEQPEKGLSGVTVMLVKKVCADVDKGIPADKIASRHRLDPELTRQLVRMYVTHPGVTPEQIMAKIGL
ncbi:MAG: metallophosphoesterase family protein [Lachnospiraceae bacterium]|jgi:putative phosphoesterase|nr:metallophosphoesterase family protein [Lachnospiraceae bacterium]